jgi:hypothetical protein
MKTTGIERLHSLVMESPDDTLFSARSLRGYFGAEENPRNLAEPGISFSEVGQAVARAMGRQKPYSEAAVRQWVRKGLRGVKLEAFGRPGAVTRDSLDAFIGELRTRRRRSQPAAAPVAPFADPADEIAAFARRGR